MLLFLLGIVVGAVLMRAYIDAAWEKDATGEFWIRPVKKGR
jgi:hypothetical protein